MSHALKTEVQSFSAQSQATWVVQQLVGRNRAQKFHCWHWGSRTWTKFEHNSNVNSWSL